MSGVVNRELIKAARIGGVMKVMELLVDGADLNAMDYHGGTPLHYAALMGNADVAELLIKHGANPNAKNKDGLMPLHVAAYQGCVDVAEG